MTRHTAVALAAAGVLSLLPVAGDGAIAAPSALCPPYKPGAAGAGAETITVTDFATANDPVTTKIAVKPGAGDTADRSSPAVTRSFVHVQVNAWEPKAKLFVRLDFGTAWDYDLYLWRPDGKPAASAAAFNPTLAASGNEAGEGGHSEPGVEQIDGKVTRDCGGYTVEVATGLGIAANVDLSFWLK